MQASELSYIDLLFHLETVSAYIQSLLEVEGNSLFDHDLMSTSSNRLTWLPTDRQSASSDVSLWPYSSVPTSSLKPILNFIQTQLGQCDHRTCDIHLSIEKHLFLIKGRNDEYRQDIKILAERCLTLRKVRLGLSVFRLGHVW